MIHDLLRVAGVFFGLLTWVAFELAGERLQGRRDLRASTGAYRIAGCVCLALGMLCWSVP